MRICPCRSLLTCPNDRPIFPAWIARTISGAPARGCAISLVANSTRFSSCWDMCRSRRKNDTWAASRTSGPRSTTPWGLIRARSVSLSHIAGDALHRWTLGPIERLPWTDLQAPAYGMSAPSPRGFTHCPETLSGGAASLQSGSNWRTSRLTCAGVSILPAQIATTDSRSNVEDVRPGVIARRRILTDWVSGTNSQLRHHGGWSRTGSP